MRTIVTLPGAAGSHFRTSFGPAGLRLACAGFIGLLGACGGGGGDDAPTEAPRVTLSSSNEAAVVGSALGAGFGTGGSIALDTLDGFTSVLGAQKSSLGLGASGSQKTVLTQAGAALLKAHAAQIAKRVTAQSKAPVGAPVSISEPCNLGGKMDISGSITSATNPFGTVGDRLSINLQDCRPESNVVLNGGLTIQLVTLQTSLTEFDLQASDLRVAISGDEFRETGSLRLQVDLRTTNVTQVAVRSPRWSFTETSSGRTLRSFTLVNAEIIDAVNSANGQSSSQMDYVATGSFGNLSNVSFQVDTVEPLIWNVNDVWPTDGRLRITGASNGTLTIDVSSTGLQIQADRNGDGVAEATSTRSWDEVLNLF